MIFLNHKELSKLYYLKKEITEQQQRIKELEAYAQSCTSNITGIPHTNDISDKTGKYASQIADLKTILEVNIKKCFCELNKLTKYIQNVDDPIVKEIMLCRYIKGFNWIKTSLNVSGRNTISNLKKKLYRYLKNHK